MLACTSPCGAPLLYDPETPRIFRNTERVVYTSCVGDVGPKCLVIDYWRLILDTHDRPSARADPDEVFVFRGNGGDCASGVVAGWCDEDGFADMSKLRAGLNDIGKDFGWYLELLEKRIRPIFASWVEALGCGGNRELRAFGFVFAQREV